MGIDRYMKMALEAQRHFERIVHLPIHDMIRTAEAHRELMRTSGFDAIRSLESFRDVAGASVSESLARPLTGLEPGLRIAEMFKVDASLRAAMTGGISGGVGDLHRELDRFRFGSDLAERLTPYLGLDAQVSRIMARDVFGRLSPSIASIAVPSLQFLETPGLPRTASVLAGFDVPGFVGVLTAANYLRPRELPMVAVWQTTGSTTEPASPAPTRIDIECDVDCWICGRSMMTRGTTVDQVSPVKVKIRLRVFPFCTECVRRADGSAEYWEEHVERFRRPPLRLVTGGRRGEPRGRLHPVRRRDRDPEDTDQ